MVIADLSDLIKITDKMKLSGTDKQKMLMYKDYERIFKNHKDRYVSPEIENKAKTLWQYMPAAIEDFEDNENEHMSYYISDIKQHIQWICHHDNKIIYQLYKMTSQQQVDKILKDVEEEELEPNTRLGGYWTFYKDPNECNGVTNAIDYAPILKPGDKYYQGYRFYMFKLCFLGAIKQFVKDFESNTSPIESDVNTMYLSKSGIFENAKIISKPEPKEENIVISPIVKKEELENTVVTPEEEKIEEVLDTCVEEHKSEESINPSIFDYVEEDIDKTVEFLLNIKNYKSEMDKKIQKYVDDNIANVDKIDKLDKENESLKNTIKRRDDEIFDLQFNKNELLKKISIYEAMKVALDNGQEKIKKYDSLVSENKKMSESLSEMKVQIEDMTKKNKEISEKAEYYDVLVREHEDKINEIKRMTNEIETFSKDNTKLNEDIKILESRLEEANKYKEKAEYYDVLVEEKNKIDETNMRLVVELKDLNLYKKNTTGVIQSLNEEITDLKKVLRDKTTEVSTVHNKCDFLTRKYNEIKKDYEVQRNDLLLARKEIHELENTIVVVPKTKYEIDRSLLPTYLNGDVFIRGCLNCLKNSADKITENFKKIWFITNLQRDIFKTDAYVMKRYWDFMSITHIIEDLPNTSKSDRYRTCQFNEHFWGPAMSMLTDRHRVCGIAAD